MIATQPCHVCGDPVPPDKPVHAAHFYGELRYVCDDCGFGIKCGNEILRSIGVKGEYLGPCGDNNPPTPPTKTTTPTP